MIKEPPNYLVFKFEGSFESHYISLRKNKAEDIYGGEEGTSGMFSQNNE